MTYITLTMSTFSKPWQMRQPLAATVEITSPFISSFRLLFLPMCPTPCWASFPGRLTVQFWSQLNSLLLALSPNWSSPQHSANGTTTHTSHHGLCLAKCPLLGDDQIGSVSPPYPSPSPAIPALISQLTFCPWPWSPCHLVYILATEFFQSTAWSRHSAAANSPNSTQISRWSSDSPTQHPRPYTRRYFPAWPYLSSNQPLPEPGLP